MTVEKLIAELQSSIQESEKVVKEINDSVKDFDDVSFDDSLTLQYEDGYQDAFYYVIGKLNEIIKDNEGAK